MGSLYSVDGTTGNIITAGSITSNSTTSGFLLPRLSTTQRNAIASPSTGLEIFNTTTNQIEYYTGSVWSAVGGGGVNPGTLNQVAYYAASGSTISGTPVLSVDPSNGLILNGVNHGIFNSNGYSVSSASLLTLSGSPYVSINSDLSLGSTHNMIFHDDSNSVNFINLKGPTSNISASYTLRMPTAQGGASTFLQNDGAGNLSWAASSGTITGSGSTSQIPKFTSGSAIGNSLLSDNGAGTFGGLSYQQSASTQSTYYITFADNSTALSSHEMFHGQINTFASSQNIGTMNSFTGNLIVVAGYKTGGTEQCFTDLLIMSAVSSSSTAVVTTVSSNSVNAPTARTYTVSQRSLFMQMVGNAQTFNVGVRVMCVE